MFAALMRKNLRCWNNTQQIATSWEAYIGMDKLLGGMDLENIVSALVMSWKA